MTWILDKAGGFEIYPLHNLLSFYLLARVPRSIKSKDYIASHCNYLSSIFPIIYPYNSKLRQL